MQRDGRGNLVWRERLSQSVDPNKVRKRVQILQEFYSTESTFVSGLDLVFEVSGQTTRVQAPTESPS